MPVPGADVVAARRRKKKPTSRSPPRRRHDLLRDASEEDLLMEFWPCPASGISEKKKSASGSVLLNKSAVASESVLEPPELLLTTTSWPTPLARAMSSKALKVTSGEQSVTSVTRSCTVSRGGRATLLGGTRIQSFHGKTDCSGNVKAADPDSLLLEIYKRIQEGERAMETISKLLTALVKKAHLESGNKTGVVISMKHVIRHQLEKHRLLQKAVRRQDLAHELEDWIDASSTSAAAPAATGHQSSAAGSSQRLNPYGMPPLTKLKARPAQRQKRYPMPTRLARQHVNMMDCLLQQQ